MTHHLSLTDEATKTLGVKELAQGDPDCKPQRQDQNPDLSVPRPVRSFPLTARRMRRVQKGPRKG